MRKSTLYFFFVAFGGAVLLLLLCFQPAAREGRYYEDALQEKKKLVRELQLTDLCLFTEARYTRHLSQADLHSPFQDYPMAFEHFPSGSLVLPPAHLLKK